MEYRQLGTSELQVSKVGLGTWALGNDFFGSVDDQESIRAIRAGLDAGINLIDTAPAYGDGHSETVVGQAIENRRDDVVLATKVGVLRDGEKFVNNLKPESVEREIDASLQRLNVDVIDLYQIHWPDRDTPLEDTLETLIQIQGTGKFKYLGVSNFKPHQMDMVRELTNLVSLQPHYSLLRRNIENNILPYCRKNNIGVLSYGTLGGGILTGKFDEIPEFSEDDRRSEFYGYFKEPVWGKIQELLGILSEIAEERSVTTTQVAINWATTQPGITTALVGVKSPAQATANAAAGNWTLSSDEIERIEASANRILQ